MMSKVKYSVRMRSSKGGPHEKGGRHISGAEGLVDENEIEGCVLAMLRRAREHSRGKADFVNLKIELVDEAKVTVMPLLSFSEVKIETLEAGRSSALEELVKAGVSPLAALRGRDGIASLSSSMRGAMLLDAITGERLDKLGDRGVRVTGMAAENKESFISSLYVQGLSGVHIQEALILASKVAAGKGIVAELCWSDDPEYVTGYVASPKEGYRRIPILKAKGSEIGGRVFFVAPGTDIPSIIQYLEQEYVLIEDKKELRR